MNRPPFLPRTPRLLAARVLFCVLAGLGLPAGSSHAAPARRVAPVIADAAVIATPAALEIQLFAGETRVLPQRHASRLAVGDGKVLSPAQSAASGFVAACIGPTLNNPFDVVKTRM